MAAMNPCPCGYYAYLSNKCSCAVPQIQRYRSKISGPLMDRIDIHIELPAVKYQDLASREAGDLSREVKRRVDAARKVQRNRIKGMRIYCNAQMTTATSRDFVRLTRRARSYWKWRLISLESAPGLY